ncbi:hypothetical protein BLL42_28260 (plasmid) [Pseudomonas frederiksbergensis]|uniref:OmpR/PhoB-type domain-containing protein n=1 Tax=Pseudomonas frederiksbergensis TaxID=104087 RepID=A0A1J0EUP9_9PSED|nr:winged helix-turn-helix domain-containing protein [Pseudomonas frederiksbergensis]APC19607.1 hypothetical protein BLL42_28260 [Pseudomonas frederiksbergensis]
MSTQEIIIKSPLSDARKIKFYPAQMVIRVVGAGGLEKIDLGYTSSRLLELLISKAGVMVEREEILRYAWSGRVVSQNNLNQSIKLVREVLDDEISKSVIQTVPRRGYMFNPEYLLGEPVVELSELVVAESAVLPALQPVVFGSFSRWKEALLGALCLFQLFLLNGQIDYELLFLKRPDFQGEIVNGNRFIYVGDGGRGTEGLRERFKVSIAKLSEMPVQGAVVVFSKMHDFYEISCLSAEGKAGAFYVHASRVDLLAEQEFTECLR